MNTPATVHAHSVGTLQRVVIEGVEPEVDGGRFPIKRTIGDEVRVQADIFADGHDAVGASLLYRREDENTWHEEGMRLVTNDRWEGRFQVTELGRYVYTVVAWADAFKTWSRNLAKRVDAGQDVDVELLIGANLVEEAAARSRGAESRKLAGVVAQLRDGSKGNSKSAVALSQDSEVVSLVSRNRDLATDTRYAKELAVVVDPEKARFSAWYEMFPRSCTGDSIHHGTFRDCIGRLDYIAKMGFDVLYLPPIHPIGRTGRKGRNNSPVPSADDVGSPWAIGSKEGGHKAVHPQLGTLEDLKVLRLEAKKRGIDLALDIAYQASPDHPYLQAHRDWFRERPDGTVQYAENPPKKYEDIYPFDFETEHASGLWEELKSVIDYWIEQEIRIFRIDNPHTKPFAFWEWLISSIKREHPEAIFLSEAFTRPKIMYRLAKAGFTQSYTYFAWRNSKYDITEYFKEITQPPVREFFRANLWPNTPDILTEFLQTGGRPAFTSRLILAATLGANYGIYGPAFELGEGRAVRKGSEEYLDSEKYQIRVWNTGDPNSLKDLIALVNRIRRTNPALQRDASLAFHPVDNEQLIAFSKVSKDQSNMLLMVVNLDPRNVQSGWINVGLDEFRLGSAEAYQVRDLLTDASYVWHGSRNFVRLDPWVLPAHILQVKPIG